MAIGRPMLGRSPSSRISPMVASTVDSVGPYMLWKRIVSEARSRSQVTALIASPPSSTLPGW
ncbi:hypothetical protein CRM94_15225 [Burkholderia gladioli]|uniref:Uncharacterized protein n=1 Tax=Burkholderia gladioli TaxID=28095 RepID=A0A2A7SIW4_BURGA|nr:hypothetical protein CO712_26740 [Burkholderia gladioli pv. gladioli]PEH43389.1 hypothetical protein CRM94_15225 [Burkholderia gladioli]PEH80679.1 hypothetical protein CRM95_20840 [Burkholderia gladioli]